MGTMEAATAPPQRPPLRRDRAAALVGGVCAGLSRRFGVDPIALRIIFLVASAAGGMGLVAYGLLWAVVPGIGDRASGSARVRLPAGGRGSAEVALGIGLLVLSVLLLFRAWGLWVGDSVAWPLVLVSVGAAVIWRQSQAGSAEATESRPEPVTEAGAAERRAVPWSSRLAGAARGRALLGAALVVGGALVFLQLNDALRPARDVVLAVVVVLVAAALILAPWWLRLWRGLSAERAERIRSQERAEMAAHLHDSVLQTLALVQARAEDPRTVAQLARRQERELRSWLDHGSAGDRPATLAAALRAAAAEVEDGHGVTVEVVTVGDRALDPAAEAVCAAAREALVNAAKFAGGDEPISVYLEAGPDRVEVFVRDRGPGFDPAAIPADRRGVRESIVGRMARHGGRASVHAASGAGTEVELVLDEGRR